MVTDQGQSLENALANTEADVDATLRAAGAVVTALRRLQKAAKSGALRELRSSIEGADRAMGVLRQQFANAKDGWSFDEEPYFSDGRYTQEVLETARRKGVRVFERDERLYCYPSLIRVSPGERAVFIDRKREVRIRPSVLVAHLEGLQRKPPRFKPEAFLTALYQAYTKLRATRGRGQLQLDAPVVPLSEIYELLTLLPGQAREYSRQEFARDAYLLDRSGVTTTRQGMQVVFSRAGGRGRGSSITVITEEGAERSYHGIYFVTASPGE